MSTTLFVLLSGYYPEERVLGVFSDREKAEKALRLADGPASIKEMALDTLYGGVAGLPGYSHLIS